MSSQTPLRPPGPELVERTFYFTRGIEVRQQLLPTAPGVSFRAGYLAVGVKVDADGRLYGTPRRTGTFVAPIQICSARVCENQDLTLVILAYVPWQPAQRTFLGTAGQRLNGSIGIEGGPSGVVPTFTVTAPRKVPNGVSIGPDGHVGGIPATPGVSEVPVRICVAGNCAGVIIRLIIA